MPLPDVFVKVLGSATPRAQPTNTGTAFAVAQTTRGPEKSARLCHSFAEFVQLTGARIPGPPSAYDWAETFFGEGAAELYFQRVFGAGAKPAELGLKKAGEEVLKAQAASRGALDPGTWGNALFIVVEHPTGESFKLKVEEEAASVKTVVEESPTFSTLAEAVAWAKSFSNYIFLTLGAGTGIPDALASKVMSGGTAGSAVVDGDYAIALEAFAYELGPGQVMAPGQSASARQLAVMAHALANNRYALLDPADTSVVAALVAAAQAVYVAPEKARRFAEMNAPWDVIPGITANTTRTVPPSARKAAQYAKVDRLGNPDNGAAGRHGEAQFVTDLSQPAWTAQQREELNNAGITISRRRFGSVIQTWGVRTLADQLNDAAWSFAPNVRTIMFYAAQAQQIGEEFEFNDVDGFGETATRLKSALAKPAMDLYTQGALYGESPGEAFTINVGPTVNTPEVLAAGKLLAQVSLRISPVAEQVIIYVVKVPITQALT